MGRAEEQIAQYLYQGESIREAFDVGPARAVLSSHRVFVSRPDDEGIRQAELPNVTGVERTTRGSRSGVVWGVALGIIGLAFLAVGLTVRASEAFTTPEFQEDAAARAGAGGLTDLVGLLIWVVENLDTLMLWTGAVFFLFAVLPVIHYWFRVRERTLAVKLAGEQANIHLPLEYISVEDEFRLERALVPEQVSEELQIESEETVPADSAEELPAATEARETGLFGGEAEDSFEWVGTEESPEEPVDGEE